MTEELLKKIEIQNEAEKAHEAYNCQSSIALSMGMGKTVISIRRIEKQFLKNPNAKILISGAREIYLENFKQELIKFEHGDYIPKITFCCIASLHNFVDNKYDFVCIDEAHKDTERALIFLIAQKVLNFNIEILCLTGTPKRRKGVLHDLDIVAPISYSMKMDNAIEKGFLNDYNFHILYHDLEKEEKTIAVKYKEQITYYTEQQRYNTLFRKYENSPRVGKFPYELMMLKLFFKNLQSKEAIAKFLLSTSLKDKKTLIYAGSINQTETFDLPSYHSKLPKELRKQNFEDFCNDEFLHLVDVNGIKESVNIPNLTHGLMLAPDASENALKQSVGRFLRLTIGEVANFIVLCAINTQEHKWLDKAIDSIPPEKVTKTYFDMKTQTFKNFLT